MMKSTILGGCVGILGVLILGGCLGVYFSIPKIVAPLIAKNVVLENGTLMMEKWQDIPLPVFLNVYLFNVTNAEAIVADPKNVAPKLTEIGPYIFRVERERQIKDQETENITYSEKRTYHFDSTLSGELSLTDEFTMVNLPIIASAVKEDMLSPIMDSMPELFEVTKAELGALPSFHQCTARQFLFDGCFDPKMARLLEFAQAEIDGLQIAPLLNETIEKHYEYVIDTGKDDIASLGHILRWKRPGKDKFQSISNNLWSDPKCKLLKGSDGTIFPPSLKEHEPLFVFVQDVCRSFEMEADQKVEFKGLTGLRYKLNSKLFQTVKQNPDNKCYCNDKCSPYEGLLEIGKCKGSIPMTASNPHYLDADKIFQDQVTGLRPNPAMHQMIIDIEPRIGIPMRIAKRIQINIDVTNVKGNLFKGVDTIPKIMFPIFWMDENAELSDDLVDEITDLLDKKLGIVYIVLYVLFGLSSIMILGSLCCLASRKKEEYDDIPLQMKGRYASKF